MGNIWDKFEPIIVNGTGYPAVFAPVSLSHGRYEEHTARIAANTTASPAMKVWSSTDSTNGVVGKNQYTFSNGMSLVLDFSCPNDLDFGGGSQTAGLTGANAGSFTVVTTPNRDHKWGGCCGFTTWAPTYEVKPAT